MLERSIFQYIMMKTGLEKMEERVKFLSSVPLLKDLEQGQLQRIADVLEAQFHPEGECIIRQGEQADSFFIIQSGEVRFCSMVYLFIFSQYIIPVYTHSFFPVNMYKCLYIIRSPSLHFFYYSIIPDTS